MKKRFIACILSGAMVLTAAGCTKQETDPNAGTALEYMEKINSKNLIHLDGSSRLWYTINPVTFADSNKDGIGELKGIIDQLDKISDGDEKTLASDINMNGIYIQNILNKDGSDRVIDYYQLAQSIGTEEDLSNVIQEAKNRNLAVMIGLDLAAVSKENAVFKQLYDAAQDLPEDQGADSLPAELTNMFNLTETPEGDSWVPLGNSGLYYLGYKGTDSPALNQDSDVFRNMALEVIHHYQNLGVTGFYLHNAADYFPGEPAKSVDFINWLTDRIHETDPNAIVCVSADPYDSEMSKIQANLSVPNYSGAEGYITKAVTGTITAKELGEELKAQQQKTPRPAAILNSDSETFDLLKKESRLPELKMAMALHLLMSGQVFISAGDEIGLQKDKVAVISDAMVVPAEETEQSGGKKTEDKTGESLDLVFGSMADQNKNGNSLLNFVRQAVLLRDSFIAASSGSMTVLDDLTTDQVLAVKKDADGSSVVLVYNLSNSPVQVDTSSVQILGLPCELGGVLLTDANEITFENNILSMPAYSAAVLK